MGANHLAVIREKDFLLVIVQTAANRMHISFRLLAIITSRTSTPQRSKRTPVATIRLRSIVEDKIAVIFMIGVRHALPAHMFSEPKKL
ncbi:hypothetical protein CCR75_002391 [Bremia lactucae]|uniref:Uncharacterized protein n=1 Tax=Bremia lactucae TaxID=4779 RepID=A0A976FLD8_BRELC|nr:hypothetical protein CCR75_002391 [Bremia lactucae]